MTPPNVQVSIDRTGITGAPPPLIISGIKRVTTWHLVSLQTPGKIQRRTYMPPNPDVDGDELIGTSLQQGILAFSLRPEVATEAALDVAVAELEAAVGQFSFDTTTTIGNAAGKVWTCDAGSVELAAGRSFVDLRDSNPTYIVTIPCFPISGGV